VTLVELEFFGWSTTLLVLGLIASHYFHVFSIVDAIRNHFVLTLSITLGYFPAGAIWMIFKWFLFLHKFSDARKDVLVELALSQKSIFETFLLQRKLSGYQKVFRSYILSTSV
jgi:hypothetical protein